MFDSAIASKEDEIRGWIRRALVSLNICISIVLNTTATLSGKLFRPQKPSVEWWGFLCSPTREHSIGKRVSSLATSSALETALEMKATLR